MEDYQIENGLNQAENHSLSMYYSFIRAVLFLCDETDTDDYEQYCDKINSLYNSQPQKIDKITKLIEKFSFENRLTVYKHIGSDFKEVAFSKYTPQTDLNKMGILPCKDTPLYKIYNSYFYKRVDLIAMIEKCNKILNNEYALAHGYSNNVLKFMYEFSEQTDMNEFLKLPLETQKQDVINFAEKMKLKISPTVGESIAIVLDGKLKRTRGANKK